jgi:hypothetical protein
MSQPEDDELCAPPFPSAESLRKYIGKWVGCDDDGNVRVSGETARDAGEKARAQGLVDLAFFWVPNAAVIG